MHRHTTTYVTVDLWRNMGYNLGMYVRTVTRRKKDGSIVRYLQLAHNEWDPRRKCAVARVLYNFGREEEVDREAVRRLVESLSRLLPPVEAAETQARIQGLADVHAESSRPFGGAWLLDHLWQRFGIDAVLRRLLAERRFKPDFRHLKPKGPPLLGFG